MKYFEIIDKILPLFQSQWKIENISGLFLQYSVLCEEQLILRNISRFDIINDFQSSVNNTKLTVRALVSLRDAYTLLNRGLFVWCSNCKS